LLFGDLGKTSSPVSCSKKAPWSRRTSLKRIVIKIWQIIKSPRYFFVSDSLPMLPIGKIDKNALKEKSSQSAQDEE